MNLTTGDIANLIDLAISDLRLNKCLLGELRDLEEQGVLGGSKIIGLYSQLISLSIVKAKNTESLVVRNPPLVPDEEGVKLIEFWLKAEEQLEELEDKDEQED
ncbi:MAG: hypothetical protein ACRC80_29980 [Waterburya sp.]